MNKDVRATRILIVDSDEASFQFCRCMAQVLSELPPVELVHAHDAAEALGMVDEVSPDVVVLVEESEEERDLFLDSLQPNHPPVIIPTDDNDQVSQSVQGGNITRIACGETLEGIHRTLTLASALGSGGPPPTAPRGESFH